MGLVLDTLNALNLSSNTLVLFVNDNGGDPDWPSDNSPLRDAKTSLYEGGVRVPYVLSWPGRVPAGQVFSEPAITLDLLPTLLAAAGAAAPMSHPLDGVDLLPLVTGQTNALPRHPLLAHPGQNVGPIRCAQRRLEAAHDRQHGRHAAFPPQPGRHGVSLPTWRRTTLRRCWS